jgi:DivIVA domain-containing protein
MALDRDAIARRDFPTHRRGYDPTTVDAHLEQVAREVEALQRRAAEPATISSQAGEQVRAIVQAAERGAQEIRETADAEARGHVARVTEAADRLRARIEQMERDVTQLVIDLRTDAGRLRDDLAALRAGAGDLGSADAAAEPTRPAAAAAPRPAPPGAGAASEPETSGPAATPGLSEPPTTVIPAPGADGDAAAARIVALDMALSGTPRDATDRYLAEHYDVTDRASLLDEVYAAAAS